MRAVVYHGQSDIRIESVQTPTPNPSNIIVEVSCCLICGTDLKIWRLGNPKVIPPRILGHELVGKIVHIGSGDTSLRVGDRVTVATTIPCGECALCRRGLGNMCEHTLCVGTTFDGAFADYIEIPMRAAHHLVPVPDWISDEAAAICEPLSCAINAHEIIRVQPGDSVAIIGGGPLGAIHAELAKAEGAKQVFLVGSTRERLKLLQGLKDIVLIDNSTGGAEEKIKAQTQGLGADKVVVSAPVESAFQLAFRLVRKGGAISHFASLPRGESELRIDTRTIHYNELIVAGVSDSRPEHVQKAVHYLAEGKIDTNSIITDRLVMDDIVRGLELMRDRKCLKVAVYPTEAKLKRAGE